MKRLGKLLLMLSICMLLAAFCSAAAAEEVSADIYPETYLVSSGTEPCSLDDAVYDQAYEAIFEAILAVEDSVDLRDYNMTQSDAIALYYDVYGKNPELFYLKYITLRLSGGKAAYMDFYYDEEKLADKVELDEKLELILSETVRPGMTELELALAFHDYLVDNCEYWWDIYNIPLEPSNPIGSAYGALVNGVAVCQGYAMAYRMLLNSVGIESDIATSDDMNHAWNLVCIDDEWYHVDVTWDDPVPNRPGWGRYDFFLISDDTIKDAEHEHYGWDESKVSCSSKRFESGCLFNGAKDLLHYYDGRYYGIRNGALYSGELEGEAELVCELPYEIVPYFDPVMLAEDNMLYAIFFDYEWLSYTEYRYIMGIGRLDITTGEYTRITEAIEFKQFPSPDGLYSEQYDIIGLRISEDGTKLEAMSVTRREVLITAELADHPVGWDNAVLAPGEHIKAVGIHERNGSIMAAVLMDDTVDAEYKVFAAFYSGGRMVKTLEVSAAPEEGLQILEWENSAPEEWDGICLFVLDGSFVPVCTKWDSAA